MATMTKAQVNLQFGASWLVPGTAKAAWGARLIFPADLLPDRQGFHNWDSPDGQSLKHWLNQEGALKKALAKARALAKSYRITPDGKEDVILFEDTRGIIKGSPNASYGYLYVAGWLKSVEGWCDLSPAEINEWSPLTQAVARLMDAHWETFNEMEKTKGKRQKDKLNKALGTIERAAAHIRRIA